MTRHDVGARRASERRANQWAAAGYAALLGCAAVGSCFGEMGGMLGCLIGLALMGFCHFRAIFIAEYGLPTDAPSERMELLRQAEREIEELLR